MKNLMFILGVFFITGAANAKVLTGQIQLDKAESKTAVTHPFIKRLNISIDLGQIENLTVPMTGASSSLDHEWSDPCEPQTKTFTAQAGSTQMIAEISELDGTLVAGSGTSMLPLYVSQDQSYAEWQNEPMAMNPAEKVEIEAKGLIASFETKAKQNECSAERTLIVEFTGLTIAGKSSVSGNNISNIDMNTAYVHYRIYPSEYKGQKDPIELATGFAVLK